MDLIEELQGRGFPDQEAACFLDASQRLRVSVLVGGRTDTEHRSIAYVGLLLDDGVRPLSDSNTAPDLVNVVYDTEICGESCWSLATARHNLSDTALQAQTLYPIDPIV